MSTDTPLHKRYDMNERRSNQIKPVKSSKDILKEVKKHRKPLKSSHIYAKLDMKIKKHSTSKSAGTLKEV